MPKLLSKTKRRRKRKQTPIQPNMRNSPVYIYFITIKYRLASLFLKKPKKYYLFLDDKRTPDKVFKYTGESEYIKFKWIIVRNYNKFIKTITKRGLPDLCSFDHDLADIHTKYFFENGGYKNPPDPLKAKFTEKTGFDCAKWMSNFCIESNLKLPKFKVHSANPCGKENIEFYLRNHIKHCETNQ